MPTTIDVPVIRPTTSSDEILDPVLAMRGVGRELWLSETGDRFIERLRSEDGERPAPTSTDTARQQDLKEIVWQRLRFFSGQEFRTKRDFVVTYEIEGDGIWFYRDGARINRKLSRRQVEIGIARCPLKSTTEIKDLIDYPYLFAVLMDRRIRESNW